MVSNSHPHGIFQRLKKLIVSMTNPPSLSVDVPIEDGSSRDVKGFLDTEILVEFRHGDRDRDRDGSTRRDQKQMKESVSKEDGLSFSRVVARDEDDLVIKIDRGEAKARPLLRVPTNINEKSDAYIESRKKAMSRYFTLDYEKS